MILTILFFIVVGIYLMGLVGRRALGYWIRKKQREFAESGQDLLDVAEEGVVRPDDEGAGAGQPLPVRVEQVGDAVQRDDGLARARSALDDESSSCVGPHDVVLLALERGDRGAHPPGAALVERGEESTLADELAVGRPVEQLVVDTDNPPAFGADVPAPRLPLRRNGGRGVEGARGLGSPVDDERVSVVVGPRPTAPVGARRVLRARRQDPRPAPLSFR